MLPRSCILLVLYACVLPPASVAQPSDDVRMIRLKISAGDLPSAESILVVRRYLPTRLTESRLSAAIAEILR